MGKILENNVPVFVITFTTQEILLFRSAKTREVKIGAEDKVERCMYAAVITRVEEELGNELTGGWKVIEVCFGDLWMLTLPTVSTFPDGAKICNSISLRSHIKYFRTIIVTTHCIQRQFILLSMTLQRRDVHKTFSPSLRLCCFYSL
jgi:hypothetical protein